MPCAGDPFSGAPLNSCATPAEYVSVGAHSKGLLMVTACSRHLFAVRRFMEANCMPETDVYVYGIDALDTVRAVGMREYGDVLVLASA